jgi:glycerol-3-phosphate dehydrogenase (NAD(P)+)
MNIRIGILGGGSWGTALAMLLAQKNMFVELWVRSEAQALEISQQRSNTKYLPGITINESIIVSTSLAEVAAGKDIILLAVPTNSVREILTNLKGIVRNDQVFVNVAKGIETKSMKRISEIVNEYFPLNDFAVLSGPSHAEEVSKNIPTTVVSASVKKDVAEMVQDAFSSSSFRVYTNPDVIGVELGGALKNIIALGAGISDGLGYGDNTKAALMTRGIYEMSKLGTALGADSDTFSGLAGIGDLIVTCTSMHSRNRRAGILIGKGLTMDQAAEEVGMIVEGIKTTESAYHLARNMGIDMPITKEIYNVLFNGADVGKSVARLMGRAKKHEMELVASTKKTWL